MKIEKTDKGFKIIKMRGCENIQMGGLGICDSCNKASTDGVLIPVLNMWFCEHCFNVWHKKATFYEEDVPYETRNVEYYKEVLHLQ